MDSPYPRMPIYGIDGTVCQVVQEGRQSACAMTASGFAGVRIEGKPSTQAGSAAKRFRNNLFEIVHPIDSCAIGLAVEADAVVGFGNGVGDLLPKPQNTAIVAFLGVNKSAFVRRSLKVLKAVHSGFSMCSLQLFKRDPSHRSWTALLEG
jgi:hypothetical protein